MPFENIAIASLISPQIAEPASDPDHRFGVLRVGRERLFRLREIGFELLLVCDRRRDHQRLAGERGRFRIPICASDAACASS